MGTVTKKLEPNALVDRPYSHGFESIYAFETIDTSSIRVMSSAPSVKEEGKALVDCVEIPPSQTTFDFLKTTITPFFLRESIEILKLSSHAERYLRSIGHENISDILTLDFSDITFLRGLGQGHIEEIRTKLKEFINGRSTIARTSIDYISWARSFFRGMDKRVVGVVFEHYGLIESLPLNTSERVEIKKLPQEKKQEWFHRFKETCRSNRESFDQDLNIVFETFVKPWMLGRGGIAGERELTELAWRLGDQREESEKVLAMFAELLCDGAHPFFHLSRSIVPGVYVANKPAYKMVSMIVKVLQSYFYSKDTQYDLDELAVWVEREFACAWIELDQSLFKRLTHLFKNYKILRLYDPESYLLTRNIILFAAIPSGELPCYNSLNLN